MRPLDSFHPLRELSLGRERDNSSDHVDDVIDLWSCDQVI